MSEFRLEIDSKCLKIASKLLSNSKLGQFSAEIGVDLSKDPGLKSDFVICLFFLVSYLFIFRLFVFVFYGLCPSVSSLIVILHILNVIQLTASPIHSITRLLNSARSGQKWWTINSLVAFLLIHYSYIVCFREKCTFWLSLEVVKIWIWILPFYLSGLKRDEAAFKHFIDKWELLHGQVYKSFSMSSEVKGKILPNPTPLPTSQVYNLVISTSSLPRKFENVVKRGYYWAKFVDLWTVDGENLYDKSFKWSISIKNCHYC